MDEDGCDGGAESGAISLVANESTRKGIKGRTGYEVLREVWGVGSKRVGLPTWVLMRGRAFPLPHHASQLGCLQVKARGA